ncbi:histone-lysine N-methyltransferase family member SUVH9-like isoform X2 [Cynara cardunculus var. scolymus]|uniref:histone-lysine N-methyltransferase family member SUVH9-like isoform X2 n=1 Tax=Cynara cardunculus var. scolymus TaxID=59895 RepID=UPI000D626C6C|nr:histone-lysine N-methyltransferase family member SUVH9-like isoform X2 [Cynara cardunculus var. scolymus]
MASLIDLNLYPDPPNTATIATGYATTAATLITPKIEPKLEPLDQPLDVPPQPYLASIPIPNPNPNPTFTLIPQHPTLVPDSNLFGAHPEVDQNNVYSEFHRISELFRTAFAKNMDKYDDIQASDPDSQAIVSVPAENQLSPVVVSSRRKYPARSSELVRVTNLGIQDERMELCVVGMHGQAQAGIDYLTSSQSSNGEPIATSVIVSGGYEDDEDAGDVIVYTGHGGQDKNSRQVVHQKLEGGNLAMERSMHYGIEVRVIRGFRYEGSASGKVYVYDGLYKIVEAWFDVGKSGFGVFKFKLVRMENQSEMGSATLKFAENLRTRPLEVRPVGYVSFDISMNKEKAPVFLFNDIDGNHEPMYYDYLVTTVSPPFVYHLGGKAGGCNCVSGCSHDCFCAKKNGGEFAYDSNGLLVRGKPLIFECGPHCRCPPSCQNRVSQNGLRNRFEVFRSRETGWGVRSLDLIQAGSFICEYTGVVLTREQAQLFTMNGDSLVYPNRFGERWAEWGDLSQIFSDYVRPSYPSVPPLDFAMDVSRMRNLACYMSHSSCPNVLVQLVLYDHSNFAFPHLMLFAMENIPPLRELSLDYGASDEWMGKLSICN